MAQLGVFLAFMETKVVKFNAEKPDVAAIREAAAVLDSGGLVVFPTETVYGIGCRVEAGSLRRLDELKKRSAEKHYTLHIGRKEDLERYVPRIPVRAEKLISRAWPGPVTIVFELDEQDVEKQADIVGREAFAELYRNNSIGVRCPDNAIASMLLVNSQMAVVAPSANLEGCRPATDAGEVLAQLYGLVDLVLDGGACRLKKSSTVVKMGRMGWDILREGVYSAKEVAGMSTVNILFVCTGNTCRSPMAEGLCRKYLSEKLGCKLDALDRMGYKVSSAGVMSISNLPASAESVAFCASEGVLLENGIADPIGEGKGIYENCGRLVEQGIRERFSELVL